MSSTRLAVALDVPDRRRALELVEVLGGDGRLYKVGLELFTREGPAVVRAIRDREAAVFLDLKLHDIPTTVGRAVEAAVAHEVDFLTVHATGGTAMMEAAVAAAGDRTTLLAVTVLTSLSSSDLGRIWDRDTPSVPDEVERLAASAVDVGVGGVVASAREAARLRRRLGPDVVLATPGIRREGDPAHDQSRVATPAQAVRAGADLLVLGRTVTGAPDPRRALRDVEEELRGVRPAGEVP